MQFSDFGIKFQGGTGIGTLMQDLKPVTQPAITQFALGGGNPSNIPAVNKRFQQALQSIANDEAAFQQQFGTYDGPLGHHQFIDSLVKLMNDQFAWGITADNVALTNGSQNAFFMLFNMLAGNTKGVHRKILLPITPEYIGYEDVSIGESIFVSNQPEIEHLDEHLFKYRLRTDSLHIDETIAALCVSRPTNPTGNVITDEELSFLETRAKEHDIPLIIDNAYGAPFPNIIQCPATLTWNENIILSMSVSKMGLPGARTGIVIARPEVINGIGEMNAVFNLAPSSFAPAILEPLFASGEILELCNTEIKPFYKKRADIALQWFLDAFKGLPAKVHKLEGSIFLWLWFPELSISSQEFYERLKARGVLVVPGQYFFPGADKNWPHINQCLRINIASDADAVKTGIGLIADELKKIPPLKTQYT